MEVIKCPGCASEDVAISDYTLKIRARGDAIKWRDWLENRFSPINKEKPIKLICVDCGKYWLKYGFSVMEIFREQRRAKEHRQGAQAFRERVQGS